MKTIEKIIGCGQVEELVEQANDELSLIEDYYRSECTFVTYILGDRLWEGPKIENPQVYRNGFVYVVCSVQHVIPSHTLIPAFEAGQLVPMPDLGSSLRLLLRFLCLRESTQYERKAAWLSC